MDSPQTRPVLPTYEETLARIPELAREVFPAMRRYTPHWCGVRLKKYPNDLMAYQQIIYKLRPQVIVECGTKYGGSALFFAHMMDLAGYEGQVVTIDTKNSIIAKKPGLPDHPRITYLSGSSVDPDILELVGKIVKGKTCMVSLDSDHRWRHVYRELRAYHKFVSPGQYLVCEDTVLDRYQVSRYLWNNQGPNRALTRFLKTHGKFYKEGPWERRFLLTVAPGGWLAKRKTKTKRISHHNV